MAVKLDHIPHSPGVYLMRDSAGRIIYIGKALDLKKRVSSYFLARPFDPKVSVMLASVQQIDYIPVPTEKDAMILEQKLIHKIRPLYNIMWRDDKSFPFVELTVSEDYPRLALTRKKKRRGSRYFGPYPNVKVVRRLLRALWKNKWFPLRMCKYDLKESEIAAEGGLAKTRPSLNRKVQSCIYLHTHECPAPCVGKITKPDYGKLVKDAEMFFRGKSGDLAAAWEKEMQDASSRMDYERAAEIRDRLSAVQHVSENVSVRQVDENNLSAHVETSRALSELKEVLKLPKPPLRIEGFDVSNIQATEPVASMVTFERGKPAKSGYRKFKIKTVEGQDDFAMMEETVFRRYRRLKEENLPYPDLVLIDGGKGQLAAAVQALKKLGLTRIPIASLAKQEEEVFLPGSPDPVRLPKDSPALHVLQAVRDEAHRFAVSFHRLRRNKAAFG